ncbi:hypothetical protein MMC07_004171 [Pseudocyphellaria aurata]|nr:hypothetical protein [Pseudocyphellaria aurata]
MLSEHDSGGLIESTQPDVLPTDLSNPTIQAASDDHGCGRGMFHGVDWVGVDISVVSPTATRSNPTEQVQHSHTRLLGVFSPRPLHQRRPVVPGRGSNQRGAGLFDSRAGGSVHGLDENVADTVKPIPILWRLRTTKAQKTVLTCIFSIAAFVCVVSIIRLVVLSRLTVLDITWNFVNAAIWTSTESSLSVVSACIPSLRPLVTLIIRGTHQWPSMDSASTAIGSKTTWRSSKNDDPEGTFIRLEEPVAESQRAWGRNVYVEGGRAASRANSTSVEEVEVPAQGIQVKTEITLISTDRLDYHDRLY